MIEPTQVQVSYTVTDANGDLLFTSSPVTVSLTITSSLTTVDLGNLDTTGFAEGSDTITVTVADRLRHPDPRRHGPRYLDRRLARHRDPLRHPDDRAGRDTDRHQHARGRPRAGRSRRR